ncbi:MAG: hypothetical protein ACI88H_003906 [Cocleimonas sp.]|jgi:hypothetical protein
MASTNKFGLKRHIPAEVTEEVRRNSKFGCVVCRAGFYQYEHIEPTFENAKEHNSDNICCLCAACHDAVTRRQMSKSKVRAAYEKIRNASHGQVEHPHGPVDFHDGTAQLVIGGIGYYPAVQTIVRHHGVTYMSIKPGVKGEPGSISAVFSDDDGNEVFALVENAWVGHNKNWDISVKGQRITIRKEKGRIALRIRLDPPGKIVIERLNMRFSDAHIVATENNYAVGRYFQDGSIVWVHAQLEIEKSSPLGAAIEFTTPDELERRAKHFSGTAQELATEDRNIVMNANAGIMVRSAGISIASLTGKFALMQFAMGVKTVAEMQKAVRGTNEELCRFLSDAPAAP